VQQPPLHERRVARQLAALPGEGVQTAEAVRPVVVGQLIGEGDVEQRPACASASGARWPVWTTSSRTFAHGARNRARPPVPP
jgi:hypothetical protein